MGWRVKRPRGPAARRCHILVLHARLLRSSLDSMATPSTPHLATCNVIGYTRFVIRSFRHKGLERFFRSGSKAGIKPEHAKRLRLLLGVLDAAQSVQDLAIPGAGLHQLAGELSGLWALSVSGNWRLTFRFEAGDVHVLDYLDYH